ncbi:hypothetical protein ULMS_12700 [Patiriisocius marinistellae]|uniref:DUF4920 domain-containing protein n=1 Tax=Patiriisocius marinistellae TaxID=2494560 RepID=A0A5J4FX85_9FLAO|nr:DUF4920 domain-containing protein [Patiriisocius marinistellae]GEQ85762.1 hypothetical protein ULMS_12700 [Patiriisocius marinistellae]
MKNIALLLLCLGMIACKTTTEDKKQDNIAVETQYISIGDSVKEENILSKNEMIDTYKKLKPGDTIDLKFKTKVNEVCQAKGCWMRMDLGEEEVMVKFKDYAFFMPLDLAGKEVIVDGKAFVAEVSVEEQRHYAEDGGSTPEEIALITEPKRTLSFMSSGVLIPAESSIEE